MDAIHKHGFRSPSRAPVAPPPNDSGKDKQSHCRVRFVHRAATILFAFQDKVARSIADALALEHNPTLSYVLYEAACFIALWVGDMDLAARYTGMYRQLHESDDWRGYADCFS